MQDKLEEEKFYERLVFRDEETFHTNGKVNRQNVPIWGEKNPHATIEKEEDLPKANVVCAISKDHVHGLFFFEGNVTKNVHLQMLQKWFVDEFVDKQCSLLIANEHEDFIYQLAMLHLTMRSCRCQRKRSSGEPKARGHKDRLNFAY